jgi:hypothetical protein
VPAPSRIPPRSSTQMAARVAAAIQARLAVVVATAEEILKATPNQVPRHVF